MERTEEGGKGKEPFSEEFRTEWRHAIVPQALPQESCCWIKKRLGSVEGGGGGWKVCLLDVRFL